MSTKWFVPLGWIYRPVSVMGWVLTLATVFACLWVILIVDRNLHSVSDTLIGAFPYDGLFVIMWGWVASKTSK